jgi:hypothetical protein
LLLSGNLKVVNLSSGLARKSWAAGSDDRAAVRHANFAAIAGVIMVGPALRLPCWLLYRAIAGKAT